VNFPPFSLERLLDTVFHPKAGERIGILIDLENPSEVKDFAFLSQPGHSIQKMAHEHFYLGLRNGVMETLGLVGGELYCYRMTAGSNLDLEDEAYTPDGRTLSFERDIYPNYDILLCISTNSATAPLTASAKQFGFRGATMHGLNPIILNSGLAVDYEQVSERAERLRQGMSGAEAVEIDFRINGKDYHLRLELAGQEAQKSHGLCRVGPDIANLPAGEVYFVPVGGEGYFPFKLEDQSIALLEVRNGRVVDAEFVSGNRETVEAYANKLKTGRARLRYPGVAGGRPRHPGREDFRNLPRGYRSQRSPGRRCHHRQVQVQEQRHPRRHPVLP
jgi:aminopeptidase